MATLSSILVPVDGSSSSLAALEHATALAEDYGAMVLVLHVIPEKDPRSAEVRDDFERTMEIAVERARAALGPHLLYRATVGDPLRAIVEAAGQDVDLIVMGTHGRVGRLHAMLGSVAEAVVRSAPCPVLTVRDSDGGYQSFAERRHGRPSLAEQASSSGR